MKPFIKLASCNAAFFAAGVILVGMFGTLMLGDNAYTSAYTVPEKTLAQAEQAVEPNTVKNTGVAETVHIAQFKKASIDEYDMEDVKSKKTTAKTQRKKKKELKQAEPFTVEIPEDNTKVYESPKAAALGLTETRDVSAEYYTVHDEISGNTVTLNAHELICRMVNSEIGDTWGIEAIKAQTVAAYSYLRFNDAMGLRPTVGLKAGYSKKLENCVKSVEGQAVYYGGKIIDAVYSASTAGYSTTAKDIWGVDYPYLKCVESEYDSADPNWGKTKKISAEKVRDIIESETDIELSENVENWFEINSVHSGKYIGSVSIDGNSSCVYNGSSRKITGITLCNLFGIKSNAMEISYADGEFTFKSYGWGHGVGMSQWGACLYARHGWTYDQILRHYYINTTIKVSDINTKAVKRGESVSASADLDIKNDKPTVTEKTENKPDDPQYSDENEDTASSVEIEIEPEQPALTTPAETTTAPAEETPEEPEDTLQTEQPAVTQPPEEIPPTDISTDNAETVEPENEI